MTDNVDNRLLNENTADTELSSTVLEQFIANGGGLGFTGLANLIRVLNNQARDDMPPDGAGSGQPEGGVENEHDTVLPGPGGDRINGIDTDFTDNIGEFVSDRPGNDTYEGTEKADVFVFAPDNGQDTITDFGVGDDKIDLRDFTDISSVADLGLQQLESNLVIDLSDHGGGSITLEDFSGELTDAHFFFMMDEPVV